MDNKFFTAVFNSFKRHPDHPVTVTAVVKAPTQSAAFKEAEKEIRFFASERAADFKKPELTITTKDAYMAFLSAREELGQTEITERVDDLDLIKSEILEHPSYLAMSDLNRKGFADNVCRSISCISEQYGINVDVKALADYIREMEDIETLDAAINVMEILKGLFVVEISMEELAENIENFCNALECELDADEVDFIFTQASEKMTESEMQAAFGSVEKIGVWWVVAKAKYDNGGFGYPESADVTHGAGETSTQSEPKTPQQGANDKCYYLEPVKGFVCWVKIWEASVSGVGMRFDASYGIANGGGVIQGECGHHYERDASALTNAWGGVIDLILERKKLFPHTAKECDKVILAIADNRDGMPTRCDCVVDFSVIEKIIENNVQQFTEKLESAKSTSDWYKENMPQDDAPVISDEKREIIEQESANYYWFQYDDEKPLMAWFGVIPQDEDCFHVIYGLTDKFEFSPVRDHVDYKSSSEAIWGAFGELMKVSALHGKMNPDLYLDCKKLNDAIAARPNDWHKGKGISMEALLQLLQSKSEQFSEVEEVNQQEREEFFANKNATVANLIASTNGVNHETETATLPEPEKAIEPITEKAVEPVFEKASVAIAIGDIFINNNGERCRAVSVNVELDAIAYVLVDGDSASIQMSRLSESHSDPYYMAMVKLWQIVAEKTVMPSGNDEAGSAWAIAKRLFDAGCVVPEEV